MSTLPNTAAKDDKAPENLKISAAIANQPRSEPNTAMDGKPSDSTMTAGAAPKKLPPSPLVTPPMNPSEATQKAVSPRNLLPAAGVATEAATSSATDTSTLQSATAKHAAKGVPVPHVYHDYAKLSGPGPAYIRKKTGGVTQPFPDKLHEMLAKESSDDPASAIVSWLPHGRAFIVRKPKEFTANIMPKYFRQTKLTSFQRQLNLYGFRRITQGADSGAYYHPLFLQGRPSLSQRMVRQKVKGTGHKQPSDASSEPNFYAMPPVEPEYATVAWGGAKYKPTIMPPLQAQPVAMAQGSSHLVSGIDPNSPGLSSLQGAAQLLRGISSGGGAFLGPPASANIGAGQATNNTSRYASQQQTPASFLNTSHIKHAEV